ncbi:MAG: hypothetical protein H0T73_15395 [Ardenticatenales bacterium]|nr:hypothetical protein [Ardenticatenales bacterium]
MNGRSKDWQKGRIKGQAGLAVALGAKDFVAVGAGEENYLGKAAHHAQGEFVTVVFKVDDLRVAVGADGLGGSLDEVDGRCHGRHRLSALAVRILNLPVMRTAPRPT